MTVYDKAYELAKALVDSKEYQDYLKTKEELQKDGINSVLLDDFKRQQIEIHFAEILGQEVEDVVEELEKTYEFLSEISVINEFLTAEYQLSKMITDIQKILGEAIGIWPHEEYNQNMMN